MSNKIIIGVDPDTDKSGIAIFNADLKDLQLFNYSLADIFETLRISKLNEQDLKVYISAGWLNGSNFHHRKGMSASVVAKIGERTGANHEIGKQIGKFCEYMGIEYKFIKPTQSKPTHEYLRKLSADFAQFKRSNQEQRDAFYCILGRY